MQAREGADRRAGGEPIRLVQTGLVVNALLAVVKILAGIVLVLGIVSAVAVSMSPKPEGTRTADVPNLEAMSKAQTPLWVALINPLIGIAGVLVGGGLRKDKSV